MLPIVVGLGLAACTEPPGVSEPDMRLQIHSPDLASGSELARSRDWIAHVASAHERADAVIEANGPRSEAIDILLDSHVLLADDNPVNRRIVEVALARFGCSVVSVADGLESAVRLCNGPIPERSSHWRLKLPGLIDESLERMK